MGVIIDLAGQTFGRLKVLPNYEIRKSVSRKPTTPINYRTYWKCECECGKTKYVEAGHLKSKHSPTLSCGCYFKEVAFQHGYGDHPLYKIWVGMKHRCYNNKNPRYARYGGRGIKVCETWRGRRSFMNFYRDMVEGYKPGLTIERINNDGDYEKSNCRWATYAEQNLNHSRNNLISYNGATLPVSEMIKLYNIPRSAFENRLRSGWSMGKALTTPIAIRTPQKKKGLSTV